MTATKPNAPPPETTSEEIGSNEVQEVTPTAEEILSNLAHRKGKGKVK